MDALTVSRSLNHVHIAEAGSRDAQSTMGMVANNINLNKRLFFMAISFGCPHYRIFRLPKPEKKLPKDASLKKSGPHGLKDHGGPNISFLRLFLLPFFLDQQSR